MRSSIGTLLLVWCVAPASASTLYTTFGPGTSFDTGPINNWTIASDEWIAAPFRPILTATLDGVDLAVAIDGTLLSIDVLADAAGMPGTLIESFPLTGTSLSPVVRTSTSSLHPVLAADATYWLLLRPGDGTGGWYWNNQGTQGFAVTPDSGATWLSTTTQVTPAFAVNGTASVPEPATLALVLLGVLGMVWRCARFRLQA